MDRNVIEVVKRLRITRKRKKLLKQSEKQLSLSIKESTDSDVDCTSGKL